MRCAVDSGSGNHVHAAAVRKRKGRTVWLVTWDWAGAHAAVPEADMVAAVLKPQIGHETVRRIVEVFYAAREYDATDKLAMLGDHPYTARFGVILCSAWPGTTQGGDTGASKAKWWASATGSEPAPSAASSPSAGSALRRARSTQGGECSCGRRRPGCSRRTSSTSTR